MRANRQVLIGMGLWSALAVMAIGSALAQPPWGDRGPGGDRGGRGGPFGGGDMQSFDRGDRRFGGDRRGPGGGPPGGGDQQSAQGGDRRSRWTEDILRRWDTNGNGVLEAEELGDERRRRFAEQMLRGAGVEPKFPLPLNQVREAFQRQSAGGRDGGFGRGGGFPQGGGFSPGGGFPPGGGFGPGGPPGGPLGMSPMGGFGPPGAPGEGGPPMMGGPGGGRGRGPSPDGNQPDSGAAAAAATSKVPGFGIPTTTTATRSFSRTAEGRADSPAGEASRPSSDGSSPPADSNPDEKIRKYAKSLLEQKDTNHNGTIEGDELEDLRADLRAADRNSDGAITLDELTNQLAEYGKSRGDRGRAGGPSEGGGSSSDAGSSLDSGRRRPPYRFLTPTERLPKGIPDWFARLDTDGDGQVVMAEYATTWTDAKAKEFAAYDLNNDGVVTPAECMAAQRKAGR